MVLCPEHSGFIARISDLEEGAKRRESAINTALEAQRSYMPWGIFKWLFGVLVGCLIGLFTFQGVLLSQIWEVRAQQGVIAERMTQQVTNLQKQINGHIIQSGGTP